MANIVGFSSELLFQPILRSATTVSKTNGIRNTVYLGAKGGD
jgi:hypothetical protein